MPELLDGDTREVSARGCWPGREGEIGELWVRRREDGEYDLLLADPVVIVSREFLFRLAGADPRLAVASRAGAPVNGRISFHGRNQSAHYRVIGFAESLNLWLLEREGPVA